MKRSSSGPRAWSIFAALACAAGCGGDPSGVIDALLGEATDGREPDHGHGGGGGAGATGADAGLPSLEPTTLAQGDFGALALDEGSLFLVDRSGARLTRSSTAGGPLEPITAPLAILPHRLLSADASLYAALFSRPGRTELWRMPSTGGGFDAALGGQLLSVQPSVAAMAVNSSDVVSLEARPTPSTVDRAIARTDRAGAGALVIASVNPLFSDAFALDDAAAFVVRGGDEQDIVRVELASGTLTSLAAALPGEALRDLTAGEDALYFASSTRVGSLPKTGGEAQTLWSTPAYRVLTSAGSVYVATAADALCSTGTTLYRVPPIAGPAEPLVHEPVGGCLRELSIDETGVYWLTADGSQLRAFRLP